MSTVEFGVRYQWADGRTFTAGGFTEAGARRHVAAATKADDPRPVEVVVAAAHEWRSAS